jgi:hypothetical protein
MPVRRPLPDLDHVARFVPLNKQQRHPDTKAFEGVTAAAFSIREDDRGGLSTTWIEFFGKKCIDSIRLAACAYRESQPSKKIGSQALFAISNIAAVKEVALTYGKKLRVVHDPADGNAGHAEIRHFDDDDLGLLETLATETFAELHMVHDLKLPVQVALPTPSQKGGASS